MQKAEHILSLLGQKSAERPDFVFRRLYRHLYHPEIYAIGHGETFHFSIDLSCIADRSIN